MSASNERQKDKLFDYIPEFSTGRQFQKPPSPIENLVRSIRRHRNIHAQAVHSLLQYVEVEGFRENQNYMDIARKQVIEMHQYGILYLRRAKSKPNLQICILMASAKWKRSSKHPLNCLRIPIPVDKNSERARSVEMICSCHEFMILKTYRHAKEVGEDFEVVSRLISMSTRRNLKSRDGGNEYNMGVAQY